MLRAALAVRAPTVMVRTVESISERVVLALGALVGCSRASAGGAADDERFVTTMTTATGH